MSGQSLKNVLLASIGVKDDDMLPITKLADFGAVREDVHHRKFSGQATSEHNMESHGVTKQVIGTRSYMSYGNTNTESVCMRACVWFCA